MARVSEDALKNQLIAAAVSAANGNDSFRDGERLPTTDISSAIADEYEGDSEGENENSLDALDLAA